MPPEGQTIPPVDVSALPVDRPASAEESGFAHEGAVLDRGLRRIAAYGALWFAAFFYLAGLMAAMHFAGLGSFSFKGSWHIVTSVLIALFSVPTVLVLAVLRSTAVVKKDDDMEAPHAAVAAKLMKLIDKVLDKAVS